MVRQQILEQFFNNPAKDFHIREMARLLNLSKTTVAYHINHLVKDKLILKQKKDVFISFRANETSDRYRFYKRQQSLASIFECGLLDYLESQCAPRCIILFGSFAKGEHDKSSDIDLFVQANDTLLKLSDFEKRLKHKINVLFEPALEKLSSELLNNIINGIKLQGFIKLK